jgi:predicted cobalt transporter CbtA
MSLRAFHLVFIALSVLLSAWVGAWAVERQQWWLAAVFFAAGAALVVYGLRVRRKLAALVR